MEAVLSETTMVHFPAEGAQTFADLFPERKIESSTINFIKDPMPQSPRFDLIVLDGTWEQARRLYKRYIPVAPAKRVQLPLESLSTFDLPNSSEGRQLRRHCVPVREIATAHALQLLLQDIVLIETITASNSSARYDNYDQFSQYQKIANAAALAQLGPPRPKQSS